MAISIQPSWSRSNNILENYTLYSIPSSIYHILSTNHSVCYILDSIYFRIVVYAVIGGPLTLWEPLNSRGRAGHSDHPPVGLRACKARSEAESPKPEIPRKAQNSERLHLPLRLQELIV